MTEQGLVSSTTPCDDLLNSSSSIQASSTSSNAYLSRILPSVIAMTILFLLSAIGNVTVFMTLVTSPLRKTRISTIILHLTIADLVVTFLLIPSEVIWRLLRFWFAGNMACKLFAYIRAFGFYLSSMVLVVVSIDRYIAVVYPLKANSSFSKRGQSMLMAAWFGAAVCSIPQVFMWNTEPDPKNPHRQQCVTFGSDPKAVKSFTIFFLISVYFVPLFIMIIAYSRIMITIMQKANLADGKKDRQDSTVVLPHGSVSVNDFDTLVRSVRWVSPQNGERSAVSSINNIPRQGDETELQLVEYSTKDLGYNRHHHPSVVNGGDHLSGKSSNQFCRAKGRTLRMTVSIVLAFICCWTPHVVMSLWFVLDQDSAMRIVDARLADVLFILTITNSVVNPYVYGSYATEMRAKCLKWFVLLGLRRGLKSGHKKCTSADKKVPYRKVSLPTGLLHPQWRRRDHPQRTVSEADAIPKRTKNLNYSLYSEQVHCTVLIHDHVAKFSPCVSHHNNVFIKRPSSKKSNQKRVITPPMWTRSLSDIYLSDHVPVSFVSSTAAAATNKNGLSKGSKEEDFDIFVMSPTKASFQSLLSNSKKAKRSKSMVQMDLLNGCANN